LLFQVASFFAKQYDHKIVIITRNKFTIDDAQLLFGSLSETERKLISLLYCKTYQIVLNKLLEMDSQSVPKVVIIESLVRFWILLLTRDCN
jgi:hypothetical protein